MSVEHLYRALRQEEPFRDFVTHVEDVPPRQPVAGHLRAPLPGAFQQYLDRRGFTLRRHQALTIDHLRAGSHVLIATPTASGKTLGFNIPVLERLMLDPEATALYVYPTKALSQDQFTHLAELAREVCVDPGAAVYDGDTPSGRRPAIRERSRLVLTNFYMLHQTLPWAHQWDRFLRHLAFVVIDEAHTYRGVFGSNVALLIRRLRRLLALYGAEPQFVLASATIANPAEFFLRLTGLDPVVVDQDGSARGRKRYVFYNPEALGPNIASPHQETARILARAVEEDVQTLCFAVSRQLAELVARWTREALGSTRPAMVERVSPYRAGYLPHERRELEEGLRRGDIRGMVSTNALEVGIDIGSLDAVIMSGFPGTMISARQQAGRAGRGEEDSLVVWVPFADQLDQYLARHPDAFFGRPHEHAIVDLENPYILAGHLLCAAAERPLTVEEAARFFGPKAAAVLESLAHQGLLRLTPRGYVYQSHPAASQVVSLDATGLQPTVKVVTEDEVLLETMDWTKALEEAHPGAVLLHRAETYVVSALDLDHYVATAKKQPVDYWTDPVKLVDIHILDERRLREGGGVRLSWGEIEVTEQVTGYKTRVFDQMISLNGLTLPSVTYKTTGMWFTLPEDFVRELRLRHRNVMGGLHGAEHAMIGLMPLSVLCDRWDLGGLSVPVHPDTAAATVFVHEGVEGGIGLTEKGFELAHDIVRATYDLVRTCPCEVGCPSCVYSPKCSNDNLPMDKQLAIEVLARFLDVPPSP
ncbi:MAG: DEAD/DEAH box helicase [Clostridia bacterium]